MKNNIDKAKNTFLSDNNCAQSILAILGPDYGLNEDMAFKLTSGMGGGLGLQGKTCGAVIGSYMILGLEFGNQIPDDYESKQIVRKATDLFVEKFKKRHGDIDCPLLLKKDFRIAEEKEEMQQTGLTDKLCPEFIQSSIEIIEEIKSELKEAGSLDYFEDISDDWDSMRKEFFSDNLRIKAFAKADFKTGKTVADIGAGSGFITEGLLNKNIHIKVVDQSAAMIEVMKKKFKDYKNIEYLLGDAENLGLDPNSLDYAFCNMYLHHVSAPAKAIKEIYSKLNHGGKLIITDLDKHNDQFLILEQYDKWLGFNRNDIKKWFEEAGFKKVVIESLEEDCCTTSACKCSEEAKISIFKASGIK